MLRFVVFLLLVATLSCSQKVEDDFNDVRFELTDQNGDSFIFPDDLKGAPALVGFIYTHCPDICSFITANIKKAYEGAENSGDTQFILITFDPGRDTPEILKRYADAFEMDRPPFRFLTGESDVIEELMTRLRVRQQVSYEKELDDGEMLYFLNHSDKIMLLNSNAQLILEYGGSMTPVNLIIEDLNKL
jgi:protein SCO1/2